MDIPKIDDTWTLFLDRDGVINKRIVGGYVATPHEFEFLPGVKESFMIFNRLFGRIIVVTNQQGVGKGLMTLEDLGRVNQLMVREISSSGGRIDAVYYCTDLNDTPDNCRKPAPVMANRAKNDFPEIDFERSVMVGDSVSDLLFGKNKAMTTVFVGVPKDLEAKRVVPDYRFGSLYEFAQFLETSINHLAQ